MYESPIELLRMNDFINGEIQKINNAARNHQEECVYKAVLNYDIKVDKDELIRALNYDRQQYQEGFRDGARKFAEKLIEHCFYDLERLSIFEEDVNHFVDEVINN